MSGEGGPGTPAAVRAGARHGLVLVAAALAVLLSATVLAALASLADRSVEGGIRQRLADDPAATVQVEAAYRPAGYPVADRDVRAALGRVFGDVPGTTYGAIRSPASYTTRLAMLAPGGTAPLGGSVTLLSLADQGRHTRLTAGSWPHDTGGGAPIQVALSDAVASATGLRPGAGFGVRTADGRRLDLRVSGLWSAAVHDDGVLDGLADTYEGPDTLALTAPGAFAGQPGLTADALAVWTGVPDTSRLTLGQVTPLRDRAAAFAASDTGATVFHGAAPALPQTAAQAQLPAEIDGLRAPMAVARAGIYIPGTLLGALAAAALVLTARQFAQVRGGEVALMSARGAGIGRVVGGAAAQWALVAVPAALAAPYLAGPLLRGLHAAGVLDGALPGTAATGAGRVAALGALIVHGSAVLVPTARQAADGRAGLRLRMRGARTAAFQRAGTDLALVAVAVLGWLQLRQYHSPVATGGVAGIAVDPVLVLTPVVMTAAVTLLALRLLPLAAPLIDRVARRGTGLVWPMGGWQVGRGAARHTGPALLMTLALAVAALSTTALAELDRGVRDQAAFSTGGDIRITPGGSGGGHAPGAYQRQALYAALPGVRAVTPVTRLALDDGDGDTGVDLVGLNTAAIAGTLRPGSGAGPVPAVRSDLTDEPAAGLVQRLGAKVPPHGFLVPGRPTRLPLTVRTSADGPGRAERFRLIATVEDADGLATQREVPIPITTGAPATVMLPLTGGGRAGAPPHYPLRITALAFDFHGATVRRTYQVRISRPGIAPDGASWRDGTADSADAPATAGCPGVPPIPPRPNDPQPPTLCGARTRPGDLLDASIRGPFLGADQIAWQIGLAPAVKGNPAPVPALVDDALLATGRFHIGGTVTFSRGDDTRVDVRIVGRIGAVPGFDRGTGHMLVDNRALASYLVNEGEQQPPDDFWLVSTRGGRTAAAVAALRRDPSLGSVTTLGQAAAELSHDPLHRGTRSALRLSRLLAPAFAIIGFTLRTAMSARLRRREFALLRAIGVRRRQLAALLWTEQLWIALLAVVVGTVLGAALAVVIMPLVTVDDQGARVYPHLAATVPYARVAATALVTAALIVTTVSVLARVLSRVDLVRTLRAGDE